MIIIIININNKNLHEGDAGFTVHILLLGAFSVVQYSSKPSGAEQVPKVIMTAN